MHQYSGVKKGYRPARTSRGYRSNLPPTEPPLITEKYNGCDLCELCALIC